MQYTICYYSTSKGRCYIKEYLDKLEVENPELYATVLAKLSRAQYPQLHKRPLISKVTGKGYSEIRPGGQNTARLFFVIHEGKLLLLMSGHTKKDKRLKPRYLKQADSILKDIKLDGGSYEEVVI